MGRRSWELRRQGVGANGQTLHHISSLLPRLLDISPASSLSFVLDTTGSMGEEISAAKIQARHIVEQRRGSPMEPAHYILVPFHDPGNWSGEQSGRKEVQGEG